MADDGELRLELDPDTFARALRELKAVSPELSKAIRKSIRDTGKLVIADVADEIRSYPSSGRSTGMREQLARSLAVRIGSQEGGSRQGVFIVSTGRQLPANKKALVKAMNRSGFRHPVFAGGHKPPKHGAPKRQNRAWVEQQGMRYFRQSIVTRREAQLIGALTDAVEKATAAVNA